MISRLFGFFSLWGIEITGQVIKFSLTEDYKKIAEMDLFPEDVTFKHC